MDMFLNLLLIIILVLLLFRLEKFSQLTYQGAGDGWRQDMVVVFLGWIAIALGILSALLIIGVLLQR